MGSEELARLGTTIPEMLVVMIPLMIAAGIFTHITARHSVARQTEAQLANPQAAIMNKMMLYIFPIGVVVGAPFLPLAVLIYWVANNLWTLGQQYVVYRRIDAEEEEKKTQVIADRQARAPRPGQKPVRPEAAARPGNAAMTPDGKTPGAKPVARRTERADGQVKGTASTAADGTGAAAAHGASPNGAAAQSPATGAEANGAGTKSTGASATRSRTGASRPPARRPRRRR
jgi:YidC/Oxa1 family membrane protein insertase